MPYPQVEHHTVGKTLSTALLDKAATYNRLPIANQCQRGAGPFIKHRARYSGVSGERTRREHL